MSLISARDADVVPNDQLLQLLLLRLKARLRLVDILRRFLPAARMTGLHVSTDNCGCVFGERLYSSH